MRRTEATPKQVECFKAITHGTETGKVRTIIYGGAAGGGKTFGFGLIFSSLCLIYPKSRWVIIDQNYPTIKRNLFPSLTRSIPSNAIKAMNMERIQFNNGSELILMNEDIIRDPEGTRWLGLEVNGAWIEQIDRISKSTYGMVQSRLGRWTRENMKPYPILAANTNPVDNWVKAEFYEPHVNGTLPDDTLYISSKVHDNPHLANDKAYLSGFDYLDPASKARLLDGDWNAFEKENRFAYCFKESSHVKECKAIQGLPIIISFDFNVDPLAFVVGQAAYDVSGRPFIHIVAEHTVERVAGLQLKAAADIIRHLYLNGKYPLVTITGDASGHARNTQTNTSNYDYLQQFLAVNDSQMLAPKFNMGLNDSRTVINTLFYADEVVVDSSCKTLIYELKNAEAARTIENNLKLVKDRDKRKCDHFDAFRYLIHHVRKDWKPPIM